ncbi:response regulator [Microvirga tunisiensis]|uniref:Response regulator n=2 Tax=Pannonibacter tanglangensis TaxID=2750084 RepID=A0A7X5F2X9_9HYPH|nr:MULTISPECIES: response regulator [unclassified Pannonibacter]NBN64252.1 response regulator [Pannonibacter sp. XCT-34]NBN78785.1 response regulator [Pannonibacter sp. XCT-53]
MSTVSTDASQTIYIVDDDPAVRDALSVVFEMEGFTVVSFADGDSFVEAAQTRIPACVILDVHMPGRSGIDVLKALSADNYAAPIFIISGQGDIPMAVDAIRNGAFDFIEKPFNADTVVERVREGIAAMSNRAGSVDDHPDFQGADLLTRREREVLGKITAGASNKEAGRDLGISPRTVEVHRARIMEKLGAKNAADLVRIVLGH